MGKKEKTFRRSLRQPAAGGLRPTGRGRGGEGGGEGRGRGRGGGGIISHYNAKPLTVNSPKPFLDFRPLKNLAKKEIKNKTYFITVNGRWDE